MICQGIYVFKSVDKREGGTFKNAQGQDIEYNSSYILVADCLENEKIEEVKMKFPTTDKDLYNKFKELKPYTKIKLTNEIKSFSGFYRLIPHDFIVVDKN